MRYWEEEKSLVWQQIERVEAEKVQCQSPLQSLIERWPCLAFLSNE